MMFETKQTKFESLVRAYSAELYRYAYWLCRDSFQAEDLVQETFARAWKAWEALREQTAARSWLYTILRHERARLYERKRFRMADNDNLEQIADPAANFGEELEVRDAVLALPVSYREPLLLQWIGGYTCKEIADIMNITEGAVMTRLTRARIALRHADDAAPAQRGTAR